MGVPSKYAVPGLFIILLLTFAAYYPALNSELTNWDDDYYVTNNPLIRDLSPPGFAAVFSQFQNANYHPLTTLSLALDYHFAGLNPHRYHLVNVLIHVANTGLVFWLILSLLESWEIALISSALFGVHTLHVESVAWVSERKDVLYTFFFLLSLIAYVQHARYRRPKLLLVSLLLFLLSCLSKGQAVTLAPSLLLIDVLTGRKLKDRRVLIEKSVFFLVAIAFGWIAIKAQASGEAIFDNAARSYFDRIVFASYGFINYVVKLAYPYRLSAIYPYPGKGSIPVVYWICLALTIPGAYFAVRAAKASRPVFFGIGFFAVNIFPVLQLLPVGNAIMADRYSYVPSIGVFVLAGIALRNTEKSKMPMQVAFIAYGAVLGILTVQRCGVWRNSVTLWEDTVKKHPTADIAWSNLGSARNNEGKYEEAIRNYDQAIRVNPVYADAYAKRGMTKRNAGDYGGALQDLDKSIALKPGSAFAHAARGSALMYLNRFDEANAAFSQALRLEPKSPDAYAGRGIVKARLGDVAGALADLNASLRLQPDEPAFLANRGVAKAQSGDLDGAMDDFSKAIALRPAYADAYVDRGFGYVTSGKTASACDDFRKARDLGSRNAAAFLQRYCP
jgi:tetratricopeptide (TPR) repeat protein